MPQNTHILKNQIQVSTYKIIREGVRDTFLMNSAHYNFMTTDLEVHFIDNEFLIQVYYLE